MLIAFFTWVPILACVFCVYVCMCVCACVCVCVSDTYFDCSRNWALWPVAVQCQINNKQLLITIQCFAISYEYLYKVSAVLIFDLLHEKRISKFQLYTYYNLVKRRFK